MLLTITGKCPSVDRKTLQRAVGFYATYLQISKSKADLLLDFERNLCKYTGDEGYCVNEGDGEYNITLDPKFSKRKILIALAHEMVHLKQHIKRELSWNERYKMHRYKGQMYHEDMNYWDCPWEIEAFGRELGLYRQFVDYCKEKDK